MRPQVALNKNLCTKCNINYYPKENDTLNLGEYINCYYQPEGYYLDNNIYKKCYHSCKKCKIKGNNLTHNCLECDEDFSFGIKVSNSINCYENYTYYYIDKENPKLVENIIQYNESDIKDILNIKRNETEKSKEKEINYYDNILKIIEND